jgi:hypothetical protein
LHQNKQQQLQMSIIPVLVKKMAGVQTMILFHMKLLLVVHQRIFMCFGRSMNVVCKEERLLKGLQQKNKVVFDINIIREKLFGIRLLK